MRPFSAAVAVAVLFRQTKKEISSHQPNVSPCSADHSWTCTVILAVADPIYCRMQAAFPAPNHQHTPSQSYSSRRDHQSISSTHSARSSSSRSNTNGTHVRDFINIYYITFSLSKSYFLIWFDNSLLLNQQLRGYLSLSSSCLNPSHSGVSSRLMRMEWATSMYD